MSVQLMEIEKALAGPDRAAALARYDETLRGLSKRLEETLAAGVAPDAFQPLSQLREATTLARKLLRLTVQEAEQAEPTSSFRGPEVFN